MRTLLERSIEHLEAINYTHGLIHNFKNGINTLHVLISKIAFYINTKCFNNGEFQYDVCKFYLFLDL